MNVFTVRPLTTADREWVARLLEERWGSAQIVSRGRVYQGDGLPGLVAVRGEERVGLLTYRFEGDACEITSLDSLVAGLGAGSALIEAVKKEAVRAGCRRLWLITTNDNLPALGFYQKRGFELVAVHRNALELSRQLKPSIPLFGLDGIPLRDEVELEMLL